MKIKQIIPVSGDWQAIIFSDVEPFHNPNPPDNLPVHLQPVAAWALVKGADGDQVEAMIYDEKLPGYGILITVVESHNFIGLLQPGEDLEKAWGEAIRSRMERKK